MEDVLNNFSHYDNEDIIRLSNVIRYLDVYKYDEIYFQFEKYVDINLETFTPYEISMILLNASKSN